MPEVAHDHFGVAGLLGSAAIGFLVLSLIYWVWGLVEQPPAEETKEAESAAGPKSVSPGWFAFGMGIMALLYAFGVFFRRH